MKYRKLLSILHYIWGGVWSFYFLAILLAYVSARDRLWQTLRSSMCIQEPFIGKSCDSWILFFSIFMLLFMALYAITNLFSGYNYWRSKPSTINWVAASLNLINIPIGTILGVFSIVVLTSYLKNLQNKNSE